MVHFDFPISHLLMRFINKDPLEKIVINGGDIRIKSETINELINFYGLNQEKNENLKDFFKTVHFKLDDEDNEDIMWY